MSALQPRQIRSACLRALQTPVDHAAVERAALPGDILQKPDTAVRHDVEKPHV